MSTSSPIADYLQQMASGLPDCGRAQRILAEVEEHLYDRAHVLELELHNRADAEAKAVSQFGDPQTVLAEFAQQAPVTQEVLTMVRLALTLIAVLTAAYASLFLFFTPLDEATASMKAVKMLASAGVLAFAGLLLYQQWSSATLPPLSRWSVWIGALAMIAVGTANAVWTAHLGLVSGDWEYYGFVGGGLIALEGGLVATWLVTECTRACLPA